MHIGLVSQWYPPDYGGIAVYTHAMAHAYKELGHRVTVVTARAANQEPELVDDDGVQIVRVDRWVEPNVLRRSTSVRGYVRSARHLLYSYRVARAVQQRELTHAIDVVECPEINAEGLVLLLRPSHPPLVVRCHTPHALLRQTTPRDDLPFNTTLTEWLETAIIRRASLLTAPSQDLARHIEEIAKLPPERVIVVPNAIDVDTFSPDSLCVKPDPGDPPLILYVGRLERHKGIQSLAGALVQLARSEDAILSPPSRWRAVFAGPDRADSSGQSNKARLEQYFDQNGLADRVEVRGVVDQSELIALYRASAICVVPSLLYESFSYTCLQAMACGKPVVATTSGGIPEVVADGITGLLVSPGSSDELAVALRRLLGNPDLRRQMGHAARERAIQQYSHRVVAEQNVHLYSGLLRDRSE